MGQTIKIKFTVQPHNSITDKVMEGIDFGKVVDVLFDLVPVKSNQNYSIYNGILMDIRDARRKNLDSIDVNKTELETLKNMMIDATLENPTINRRISFVIEHIENSIVDSLSKETENKVET